MEPLRFWKRLGGTFEASHSSVLARLSAGDEERATAGSPSRMASEAPASIDIFSVLVWSSDMLKSGVGRWESFVLVQGKRINFSADEIMVGKDVG